MTAINKKNRPNPRPDGWMKIEFWRNKTRSEIMIIDTSVRASNEMLIAGFARVFKETKIYEEVIMPAAIMVEKPGAAKRVGFPEDSYFSINVYDEEEAIRAACDADLRKKDLIHEGLVKLFKNRRDVSHGIILPALIEALKMKTIDIVMPPNPTAQA